MTSKETSEKYGIEYYSTILCLKEGKVEKRLDATPGVGLTKGQLQALIAETIVSAVSTA